MSCIPLFIDSSKISNQNSQDISVEFNDPIKLNPDHKYLVSLNNLTMWYSWCNISTAQANSKFRYLRANNDPIILTIPDGSYSISQLNAWLFDELDVLGDTYLDGNEKKSNIIFEVNYATMKLRLELTNGFKVDFGTNNSPYRILGFDPVLYNASTNAPNQADITNGINTILIHCSIANNSFLNGNKTDVIYSFVPKVVHGAQIIEQPYNPLKILVGVSNISSIRMTVTDQLNRIIDLKSEPVFYSLRLEKDSN
ncbi:MAG: hypothetical protein RBS48_06170 [Ignavibacteriaceae bacterium]|jgi:hypothetical protein|nr:hypothetical protein [Ignavibacteriaceae bacterium]